MTPSRPYIMRALYEWIVDNACTPYILVDATPDDVVVPEQYVKDGQIVLNVSYNAVRDLNMTNEYIMFNARFSGVARNICVPIEAVLGVMARESGEGMWFPRPEETVEPNADTLEPIESSTPDDEPPPPPRRGTPSLKVVK